MQMLSVIGEGTQMEKGKITDRISWSAFKFTLGNLLKARIIASRNL